MAEPIVRYALRAKRAEIAGEIELTARKLQELRGVLRSLDDTLCLFDPSAVPENIKAKVWRPRPDWAVRGEHARRVLIVLRRANGEGMTIRCHHLADHGRTRLGRGRRISFTLRCQRDKGLVTSERGNGNVAGVALGELSSRHAIQRKGPAPCRNRPPG